jgi:predicted alpha/beta-hydrolase family hydrolase
VTAPVAEPVQEPVEITTPVGPARLHVDRPDGEARALLVLGHGAGGGVGAPDLAVLARTLPAAGIAVVRVEQPWRVAGRRVAAAPPVLDRAWLAAVPAARAAVGERAVLVVGGRSAGARVACRTAGAVGAAGVVALAFPLRPPGRPDRSRAGELAVAVPVLVVQGERDAFGSPDAVRAVPVAGRRDVLAVPAADHSFAVPRGVSRAATLAGVAGAVRDWVAATVAADSR